MDALTALNLEYTLRLEKKRDSISKKDWDKMNLTTCGVIRSCLIQDIKYHILHETSAKAVVGDTGEKFMTKNIESRLQLKRRLYRSQMKRGFSIDKHMNSYTKLLTDLVNVNVKIDEEDNAVILSHSLPDEEYETFTLTLINGRQTFNYSEVSVALVNYEVRR